ncbi:MAG: shikimate dehydrogenase [Clostridiales bacterium]|jgi:shikimate dehydrogenase|nr:shikimate dehydrogenase [Clostridiales bacterium]
MRLAVIGDPIAHSLSPAIHRAVFAELGIPLEYSAHRVEKGKLDAFIRFAVAEKIDGFNVTMPHKTDILPFCASVHAKAVNTVTLREGVLRGYSTDEKGFLLSLAERGFSVRGKQAVIAGRGGVAATLSEALINEGADAQCISVRNGVSLPQGRAAGLFINATPLGMEGCPEDWKDLSFLRKLPKDAAVYDLIYNPRKTRLLREAETLGLTAINGLDMLIYQAILSDEIYLGKELDKAGLKGKAEKLINTHLF